MSQQTKEWLQNHLDINTPITMKSFNFILIDLMICSPNKKTLLKELFNFEIKAEEQEDQFIYQHPESGLC